MSRLMAWVQFVNNQEINSSFINDVLVLKFDSKNNYSLSFVREPFLEKTY